MLVSPKRGSLPCVSLRGCCPVLGLRHPVALTAGAPISACAEGTGGGVALLRAHSRWEASLPGLGVPGIGAQFSCGRECPAGALALGLRARPDRQRGVGTADTFPQHGIRKRWFPQLRAGWRGRVAVLVWRVPSLQGPVTALHPVGVQGCCSLERRMGRGVLTLPLKCARGGSAAKQPRAWIRCPTRASVSPPVKWSARRTYI